MTIAGRAELTPYPHDAALINQYSDEAQTKNGQRLLRASVTTCAKTTRRALLIGFPARSWMEMSRAIKRTPVVIQGSVTHLSPKIAGRR